MKSLFLCVTSILFCSICLAQTKTVPKGQVLMVKKITASDNQIQVSAQMQKILSEKRGIEECEAGHFTDSTGMGAGLNLPNPVRWLIVTDLTPTPSVGNFYMTCNSCPFSVCILGPTNFNPHDVMQVYYGHCFSMPIGKMRGCKTAYGWRVEGDFENDGKYEATLKIVVQ